MLLNQLFILKEAFGVKVILEKIIKDKKEFNTIIPISIVGD